MPFFHPWPMQGNAVPPLPPVMVAIRGRGFGAESEPNPAADATAWSLVFLLVFCLVWIGTTAFFIARRLRKKKAPPDDRKADVETHAGSAERRAEWQKPDDWWKKDGLE